MDITKLHAGDIIKYSGIIYTARDQAHLRLKNMIDSNIPIDVDFKDSLIYYAGPTPTRPGQAIGSIGPTTSSRMDKFISYMTPLGIKGMIGKGPRDKSVKEACKNDKLVYFITTGGAGALLSKCVIEATEVMFNDLGCESIKKLIVKDFPLIVAYDIYGNDVFERNLNNMELKEKALKFHEGGKFSTSLKHDINNREDLSLAYTPGVASACLAIKDNKEDAYKYTSKGNIVAVISDGTAVLGLGDIGPHAGIPVMEGKANLFKKFADIDAISLCLDTKNVDEIVMICKALEPSLGGINLEDISAPRCVEIERRLIKEMNIPVMHDDQHGTSIVVAAAVLNCARLTGKNISDLTVVMSGTGAAGSNIARMLKKLGVKQIFASNKDGVVDKKNYDSYDFLIKELIDDGIISTKEGHKNTLESLLEDSNVFIGVSAPRLVTKEMVKKMKDPFVFAMANPEPEITYQEAKEGGALVAGTGRSDYPNQVNNLLAFPGIFRGALDAHATKITEGMKLAAAYALANLITDEELSNEYILPDAFDKRVVPAVKEAVYKQAIKEGVVRK